MSIEYFVEGKVIIQSGGEYSVNSKGNIVNTSGVSVEQHGKETGVGHYRAKELHTHDTPSTTIEVSLNLFFDGTQNNKTNTEAGKDYKESNHVDDSYTNDYSNVARGYDALDPTAENQVSRYIEGIGTEDLKSESLPFTTKPNNKGIPFGTGSRGVKAKVSKGCREAGKAMNKYAGKKGIHLKVNVYGFSRGATAARHFLHIATQPAKTIIVYKNEGFALAPYDDEQQRIKVDLSDPMLQYGYFGACLSLNKVAPERITFNFVGLYDTVAAYGLDHRGKKIGGKSIIDDDTKQLGLDAVRKARFVLQLAAEDEHRDNFDLTNINSTGVRGLQLTLPRVHSDVGGCYVHNAEEQADLFKEFERTTNCEKFKEILIEEGWYTDPQLRILNVTPPSEHSFYKTNMLVGTRTLYNTYDKIPLNAMFHYSQQFGVQYKETGIKDHEISDSFLHKVYSQLAKYTSACTTLRNTYIEAYNKTNTSGDYLDKIQAIHYWDYMDPEDLKTLRNKYLHWSASVTKMGLGPKVGGVTNGKERKRNIQNG